MSKHGDLARIGRLEKRIESEGRIKSPPPESSSGEPKSDYQRTLEALRASPPADHHLGLDGRVDALFARTAGCGQARAEALERELAQRRNPLVPPFGVELSADTR